MAKGILRNLGLVLIFAGVFILIVCVFTHQISNAVLGCALASAAYFLLPYPFEVRFTVMLLAFSPVSALAPVFSEKCCGEGARSGLALSLSVVAALPCMLVLAAWAG